MIALGRGNVWGCPIEMHAEEANKEEETQESRDFDRSTYIRQIVEEEEETHSLFLRPKPNVGRIKMDCKRVLLIILVFAFLAVVIALVMELATQYCYVQPQDNYTVALHKALMFFNAQRSGRLPKDNNVTWRSNSCLYDGNSRLAGGYYDAGDATKFTFPTSFAMTMLSWSVIEYGPKYEALGESDHVRSIIKWGTDYLLKTFESSSDSVSSIVRQVGLPQNDHDCWMRPEDVNYMRPVIDCPVCPAVAAETAAALASASIVFKDCNIKYSKKLVNNAVKLFKFATKDQGENYNGGADASSDYYNSTGFWDEFVWGGAWLYIATGNIKYLRIATSPVVAQNSVAFWLGPDHGVLSWDNKHVAAQLLLTRLRLFLDYRYPYLETLKAFHDQINGIMCSYVNGDIKRSNGGLILFYDKRPRTLQYAVNAAFLATLFSDYLQALKISGWSCGSDSRSKEELRDFARTQIDYILGKNPQGMSYLVGFGDHFPQQVHHRGASIPDNGKKYDCKGGLKWLHSPAQNPNTIVGAMVAGPDRNDGFNDNRSNYNYTEPSIAANAGLVAALVSLSCATTIPIDWNYMYAAVPPLDRATTPPP